MLSGWASTFHRRTPLSAAIAIAIVIAVVLLQYLLPRLPPFATLLTGVLLACFIGGRIAGIAAILITTLFAIFRAIAAPTETVVWEILGIACFLVGAVLCLLVVHLYETAVGRLRRERQRLDTALKAANAAIWEISPDGQLYWDHNFYNLVGLDPEIDPPTTTRFLEMIDPEHRERMAAARRLMDKGEAPKPLDEYRLTRPDGRTIWLENYRTRISEGGSYFIGITQDITRRKNAERRVRGLLREAAHRAKNQFTVILAMAREASHGAQSAADFQSVFGARLQALARSHDLLVSGDWKGTTVRELLLAHLEAFGAQARCEAHGPDFTITTNAAQYLGMAFHELATNALKHGALASEDGRLRVTWAVEEAPGGDSQFTLTWEELGTGPVAAPKDEGFGTKVLLRLAPAALSGTSHMEPGSDGLSWTIQAPLSAVMDEADKDAA
jgi:PAS domain S-box-containing protein